MSSTQPRAFISHAGEDKAEFGEPLATILRAGGVDAWLDKWEMLPGDSLVQKIFSEGIRGTDAVIVLVSKTSVEKPWVQKELNVAAVQNIQRALRLIPVKLDDCAMPEVLMDLLWLDWDKDGNAEGVSKRIIETLHGHSSKPPVGSPPRHLSEPRFSIPGLNARDIKVLQIIFEASLDHGLEFLQADVIMPAAEQEGMSFEQVKESVTMLDSQGYVTDEDQTIAQQHIIVNLLPGQAVRLGESYGYNMDRLIRKVVALVCNEQCHSMFALLSEITDYPKGLVEATTRILVGNSFWRAEGTMDGDLHFHSVAPVAKRWLEDNS